MCAHDYVSDSGWIVTDEGDRWSVKLDVRDLWGAPGYYFSGLVNYSGLRGFDWSLLGWF